MAGYHRRPATADGATAQLRLRKLSNNNNNGINSNTNTNANSSITSPLTSHPVTVAVASPESASFPDGSFALPPRRSSSFSDYSISEARRVLDPLPAGGQLPAEKSNWASFSLACALGPALAGVLFKNGDTLVADLMLLGLAGVFLHWCVTQPWIWYRNAQRHRILAEATADASYLDDAEDDNHGDDGDRKGRTHADSSPSSVPLVPPNLNRGEDAGSLGSSSQSEADPTPDASAAAHHSSRSPTPSARSVNAREKGDSSLTNLYAREIFLLALCFLCPLLGAYLLHNIRSHLSRPSGSLVSDFNLTIFIMASELRVVSHMINLVHSQTLHYPESGIDRLTHHSLGGKDSLLDRLGQLESRLEKLEGRPGDDVSSPPPSILGTHPVRSSVASQGQEAAMVREVRNAIQPELDALNRAVRRYEKKAMVLALQTDARLGDLHSKVDNTVALAAAATRRQDGGSHSRLGRLMRSVTDSVLAVLAFPFTAILDVLVFPLGIFLRLVKRGKPAARQSSMHSRTVRAGKMGPTQSRLGGDFVVQSRQAARR